KVLIIDEISMLDATTLSMVDRVLRNVRRSSFGEGKPFGGLQVVFVGDFFQLPPVSRTEESVFAFASEAWNAAHPIVCYLSEQHRQEDDEFLGILAAIRAGEVEEMHAEFLRSRLEAKPKKIIPTKLHTHNADVDRVNAESLGRIEAGAKAYTMQSRGSAALVEALKRSCLSPERLELKQGAAVMFTRNNFDTGYVNGTLGTVDSFASDGIPIVKTFDGRFIRAEAAEWSMQDGNKVLARLSQIPLRLAWAITVHKSQGMSLDAASIDLSRAFEYGQGYVAISRVRSLSGLFLEGLNRRALELHPRVMQKDRSFRDASAVAGRKFAEFSANDITVLHENFLRAAGGSIKAKIASKSAASKPMKASSGEYPNAGKSWSKEDDAKLRELFSEKVAMKDMAKQFGRKSSAIRARLGRMGLVKDFWSSKNGRSRTSATS
ncbi:MAG: AAA family ATPase, partial [Candidatus Paceibacterota bacterium]